MKVVRYLKIALMSIFFSQNLSAFEQNPESSDIGEGGREDLSFLNVETSDYKKGMIAFNQANKKFEKNKIKKEKKRYNDAIKFFLNARIALPENVDILNNLGVSFFRIGDLLMAEIYYQEGLELDSKNYSINSNIGKLYVKTNRISLAVEKLEFLKNCNCEEYNELKNIISKN